MTGRHPDGDVVARLERISAPPAREEEEPDMAQVDGSGQLGMDERVIEDDTLKALLERRLRAGDDKREVTKAYKVADSAAKEAIATLGLADGDAVRIGRFRITKKATDARHVEFDAEASSRLSITIWEK